MENEKRTKIFSSKLQLGLPYINWFTSKSSLRCEIIFFIIFSTVSKRICWNFSTKKKMEIQEKVNRRFNFLTTGT